ncbi:MAG: hypothetical protein R3A78_16350 [Polyangiales bacterium]
MALTRSSYSFVLLFSIVLFSLASLAGCDCSDPPSKAPGITCGKSRPCDDGYVCVKNECVPETGADAGEMEDGGNVHVDSIRIEPMDVVLDSVEGSQPMTDFDVYAHYTDGDERKLFGATFEIDNLAMGTMSAGSGEYVANGLIGGSGTVTASYQTSSGDTLTATTSLAVNVSRTVIDDDVPSDVADRFATVTTSAPDEAAVLYPLDGVVFPQNVFPADVQWTRGAENDLYRITFAKPHLTITHYIKHTGAEFKNHWVVAEDTWRTAAQSDVDDAGELTVDRWLASNSTAVAGTPVFVSFARSAVTGSVYYWDIERGLSVRIDDGTAERHEYMPYPPGFKGQNCLGCHSVSPSGRYISGELGMQVNDLSDLADLENFKGGVVYDLTTDLSTDPPVPVTTSTRNWFFSTWNPQETRIIVSEDLLIGSGNFGIGWLRLYDPINGILVPISGSLPWNATHPAWSPDGAQVAYTANKGDNLFVTPGLEWGGANTKGDIAILDVTAPDTFGNAHVIQLGTSLPGGKASSYPTWSPDSAKIAFAHGTGVAPSRTSRRSTS